MHCYFKDNSARESMPDLLIICACIRARHLDVHTHTETHTQGEKYINCIFSCTYRPVIEQQPAQFLKVSARRSVMVSQDTPAVDTQNTLIYLFVSLWRLLSFRPLKRAWAFLPLVPAPSFAYICLNACFVCVCILFCQQFRATPL